MDPYIYLVEITALVDAAGTSAKLRFATAGYTTRLTDTPADTFYDGRVEQPCLIRMELPADFGGAMAASYGEVTLRNNDGAYSHLPYYGLDGQLVRVLRVRRDQAYSTAQVLLQATAEQATADRQLVRIRLRGPDAVLDRPLISARYTNSGSTTDNNPALVGKPKPALYGKVENISPPCVNPSLLVYQVSSRQPLGVVGASVSSVYVAGVAQTLETPPYTSEADMAGTAPAAGKFRVWPGGGCFRLGTAPAGVVTCDATPNALASGGSITYPWGLWSVLREIAVDAGAAPNFNPSYTFPRPANWAGASWPATHPNVGVWVDDLSTATDVMSRVAAGAGAWFGVTWWQGASGYTAVLDGSAMGLGAQIFPMPVSAVIGQEANYTWDSSHILQVQAIAAPGQARGVPAWAADIGYRRNYTVFSPSMAPTLPAQDLGFFGVNDHQRARAEDAGVVTQFRTAQTWAIDSAFAWEPTNVGYEATRQLELRRKPRLWFTVTLKLSAVLDRSSTYRPGVGGFVYLTWPQLKVLWQDGVTRAAGWFTVQALQIDLAREQVTLTVRQATEQSI